MLMKLSAKQARNVLSLRIKMRKRLHGVTAIFLWRQIRDYGLLAFHSLRPSRIELAGGAIRGGGHQKSGSEFPDSAENQKSADRRKNGTSRKTELIGMTNMPPGITEPPVSAKTCPFCGDSRSSVEPTSCDWVAVNCLNCGAVGPEIRAEFDYCGRTTQKSKDGATLEWNRRAQ